MLILYAQHCLEMYFLAQIPYFTEFRCSDRYLSVKKIQTWTLKDLWLQVTWTCGSGSLQVFPQVNPQVTHKDLHPCHALIPLMQMLIPLMRTSIPLSGEINSNNPTIHKAFPLFI